MQTVSIAPYVYVSRPQLSSKTYMRRNARVRSKRSGEHMRDYSAPSSSPVRATSVRLPVPHRTYATGTRYPCVRVSGRIPVFVKRVFHVHTTVLPASGEPHLTKSSSRGDNVRQRWRERDERIRTLCPYSFSVSPPPLLRPFLLFLPFSLTACLSEYACTHTHACGNRTDPPSCVCQKGP